MSQTQIRYLWSLPEIRLAPDPDYPPIDFFDKSGDYTGLSADYVKRIETLIGRSFRVIRTDNFDAVLEMARDKNVDVICTAQKNDQRSEYLLFTKPVVEVTNVIIVNTAIKKNVVSLKNMDGLRVRLVKGHTVERWIKRDYPELSYVTVDNTLEGLIAVSFGLADAIVAELPTASYLIGKNGLANLKVAADTGYRYQLRIGVRKDMPELREILDEALATITETERKQMWKRWILLENDLEMDAGKFAVMLLMVGAAAILVLSLVMLWNRSLKQKVALRTSQLDKELKERILIESNLRNHEKIVSTSNDYLALLDKDFTILAANHKVADLFGLKPEELMGKPLNQLQGRPELMAQLEPLLKQCDLGEKVRVQKWFSLSDRDSKGYIDIAIIPHAEEGRTNAMSGYVISARDITRSKVLEDRLLKAQKMEAIGTLAGGIAHDFNNILGAVIGYAELALSDAAAKAPLNKHLMGILKAGKRAKDLVNQILAFSRQTDHDLKPIEMTPIVKETLKLMRATVPATVEIRSRFDADAVVMADPTQIHQVVMNLCTNAAHAMAENGGVLEVTLTHAAFDAETVANKPELRPGQYLALTVSDTGHGIPGHVLDRIFDPFFTTKEQGQGTGLGLSMVHGIVKGHGGDIAVQSKEGKGTVFTVYLPEIEAPAHSEAAAEEPLPNGNERIMFVDDEAPLAEIGRDMLATLGYRVEICTSSVEALECFRRRPDDFDLVITDLTMPKITGDQLAVNIRTTRPNMPVILCSGYGARIDEQKALEMGVDAFVFKPILRKDIARIIRNVLDRRQS